MDLKTKEESEDPVGMMEVYQEFNSTVVQKYKILEFKSKKAKKNYAFEKFDVPNTADYLEVRYSVSFLFSFYGYNYFCCSDYHYHN